MRQLPTCVAPGRRPDRTITPVRADGACGVGACADQPVQADLGEDDLADLVDRGDLPGVGFRAQLALQGVRAGVLQAAEEVDGLSRVGLEGGRDDVVHRRGVEANRVRYQCRSCERAPAG